MITEKKEHLAKASVVELTSTCLTKEARRNNEDDVPASWRQSEEERFSADIMSQPGINLNGPDSLLTQPLRNKQKNIFINKCYCLSFILPVYNVSRSLRNLCIHSQWCILQPASVPIVYKVVRVKFIT